VIIRSALRQLRHADPTFGATSAEIPGPADGWSTWAGVPVEERRALQQITVYSCVSLTCDVISTLPIGVFRDDGAARVPLTRPRLIEEPFDGVEWTEWSSQALLSLTLRGNAYALVTGRDAMGFPTQLEPLHPDDVHAKRDKRTGRVLYRVAGESEPLTDFDVLHIKGLKLPGIRHVEGLNPIAYARQTIGTSLAAEEFSARFFAEASVPPGYLQTEGKLTDDDAKRYQAMWMANHGNRTRKPAVLGGGLRFETISLKPADVQFLDTIKATRSMICGFFRTPPHLVADVERSTSWGTGIEEQNLMWITIGLGPNIIRLERAISRILPRPRYVKLNLAGLLRGRLTERYRAYLMARQGGWLSIDDIRALEEMAPLPESKGTDYITPLNYQAIPPGGLGEAMDPMATSGA
jgi:HK97 family phage portal protein